MRKHELTPGQQHRLPTFLTRTYTHGVGRPALRRWLACGYPGGELGPPLNLGVGEHGLLLGGEVDAAGLDRYRVADRVGLARFAGSGGPVADRDPLALLACQRLH